MNTRLLMAGWIAVFSVMLTGCVGFVQTGITAYAQPDAAVGKRYVLHGPDPRFPGGDPSWPGFARMLTRALEGKGFVPDAASPDLVIRVSYRVGDTQVWTTTTSTPVTGITGMETQTIVTPSADPMAPPTVSTVTVPTIGVIGTTETTSTHSDVLRVIQVEALDSATVAAGRPTVVWSVHARSRGASDDLATVFPLMVAAMQEYFGKTVEQQISVRKTADDAEVIRLRDKVEVPERAPRPPWE